MKPNLPLPISRRSPTPAARRRQLLAEFERSGLSAAAFARQHGIAYTTFCSWRHRRSRGADICFAEVELVRAQSREPLVLELGPQARIRLTSPDQLELAAGLLKHLQASC